MEEQWVNGHTFSRMIVHLVWSAKYRCSVLTGNKQKRCREVLIEICGVEGVVILKGVVRHDLECRPSQNFSTLIKKLKGRSSRKLQMEFPELKKRYWGLHFWAIGFGCWSAVNITDKMVDEYLEHHRKSSNDTDSFIIA